MWFGSLSPSQHGVVLIEIYASCGLTVSSLSPYQRHVVFIEVCFLWFDSLLPHQLHMQLIEVCFMWFDSLSPSQHGMVLIEVCFMWFDSLSRHQHHHVDTYCLVSCVPIMLFIIQCVFARIFFSIGGPKYHSFISKELSTVFVLVSLSVQDTVVVNVSRSA